MEPGRLRRQPRHSGAGCSPRNRHISALPECAACEVRGHTFCSELDGEELGSLQAIVRELRIGWGQTVFYEGEHADDVFNVVTGIVKLYKMLPDGRQQITGFVFPGDFLGVASGAAYSFSAEAISDARLCRFPRSQLYRLFLRFPKLEHRLLAIATDELTAAQDQMLLLGRKSAVERLASFLLALATRTSVEGTESDPVLVPMSRTDIADYLGLSIETVSRAFGRLKKDGLIDLPDTHEVVFRRPDILRNIAEGAE